MHELGIATEICQTVARLAGGRKLLAVTVDVGVLAGVAVDALEFCITEVARDTGLGEPEITIATLGATMECACGNRYTVTDPLDACPSCGGYSRKIASGLDIIIREIKVEEETK